MKDDDKIDKLYDNYLEPEQLDFLINRYVVTVRTNMNNLHDESLSIEHEFKDELSYWWAAWEIRYSAIYREYVRQMLIATDFIYLIRDYFIAETTQK